MASAIGLTAEKIAEGNNILGIEGSYKGNIAAVETTIIPSVNTQVQEGLYNKVTVMGDEDLISENIKKGVNIFGVDGTLDASTFDEYDECLAISEQILSNDIVYIEDGLVRYFKLNGNFDDYLGNINITNNGLTFEEDEELNKIVCRTGMGYANFNDNMSKNNITVSVLAKSNGNTAEHNFFFSYAGEESVKNNALGLKVSNGKFALDVSYSAYSTNFNVNDGLWHRYTVTLENSNLLKIYIDNNLFLEKTQQLNIGSKGLIGSWFPDFGFYFDGWLSEVLIYERALSLEEVVYNYSKDKIS